jgi:hypothetical protein
MPSPSWLASRLAQPLAAIRRADCLDQPAACRIRFGNGDRLEGGALDVTLQDRARGALCEQVEGLVGDHPGQALVRGHACSMAS